ncbi:uncharacterized protein V1513DRAFT_460501 [Lipomyces chichibuensis]|uniref:uncharacterized protein n=1 Tax=Lipomyces chichibuensis TaxID=1546026 RepID=UPI0033439D6B
MSVTDTKTLLKEDTPEQRLDVQMPYEEFLQLDDAFCRLKLAEGMSEDQRYPSLAYNSVTLTVTVLTCPGRIHKGAAHWIDTKSLHTPHTVENIQGETYDKLLEDKDVWIEGMRVNVFMLICFKESHHLKILMLMDAEKVAMAQSLAETFETNLRLGYYGPLAHKDHIWVGELKEAFIEVWRQDSHRRLDLIQEGFVITHSDLPVTLELKISDFYPVDAWQSANVEEDTTIPTGIGGVAAG